MTDQPRSERHTQNRVVGLFTDPARPDGLGYRYIHTYKFHQGVADGVILDLKYEARDVPQRLTSQQKVDEWFDRKTRNLNNFQKAVLRKR